jgi:16S rRNA processing protein RimM
VIWDDMAVVGTIARPHGIRGQVILNAETDFPEERFQPGHEVFVERRNNVEALTLTAVRFHRGRPIVGIAGVETIEGAQELSGLELRVPPAQLVPLPAGTFYRHDLAGCQVETVDGAAIGVVADVEGTLGASRLVVLSEGQEILIPLAADICTAIDAEHKRIVVDPPAGLLELNREVRHRHNLSGDVRAAAGRGRSRAGG